MKKYIYLIIMSAILGCTKDTGKIYENKDFTVFKNKVTQGKFSAQVLPDGSMTSNYKSPANNPVKRTIEVKFSINQKDNELPFATNHQIVIQPKDGHYTAPVITFGKQFIDPQAGIEEVLEPDTEITIKLDMRSVFDSFKTKGFYIDLNGEKITQEDFKGIYLAGNIVPLSFDFENLGQDVQLTDEDDDHIFEITLKINTYDPDRFIKPSWKLSQDISAYPQLKTDIPLLQSLYNMALEETVLLSEKDGTFRTGAKWAGVWTRDVSYAIVLGMGMTDRQRARTSLLRKVKNKRIIQDTGSGGAWPVSSDRTTWALAAWEIYLLSGDELWLEYTYQIIQNTIEDDRKIVYNKATGLYRGESSFLDWRIQTYPRWMDNIDIYQSQNLGTNMVHYKALVILSDMAKLQGLNDDAIKYSSWAEKLKKAINEKLWNKEKGYYIQYLYGRDYLLSSPKSEALGEAFSVLFGVAEDQAYQVIANTPVVSYGIPCVYPQIPNMRPYHNNGIWPFVQAFWNMAAAKTGNGTALEHGLGSFYRSASLFLTNKENMVAENGDFMTALNSDRQLWSVAANLGQVYKILFGIHLTAHNTLEFKPTIPSSLKGKMELSNLKIRDKELSIRINGYGNQIKTFKIDGKTSDDYVLNLTGEGRHLIEIQMANNELKGQVNLQDNRFHLPTPQVQLSLSKIEWDSIKGAVAYEVYKNGSLLTKMSDSTRLTIEPGNNEYSVRAIDARGDVSFFSEPVCQINNNHKYTSMREYARDKNISINDAPSNMIELSKTKNTKLTWQMNINTEGEYILYFDYSNGSGPWNTDNKCATRTLWVNGVKTAPIVMAQRGSNEWGNIGQTNRISIPLHQGINHFILSYEPENENMNTAINTALLGNMTILKKY
jgi:hypothetical protein